MFAKIFLIALYVFIPALLIFIIQKVKSFQKIGVVLLSYAVGLIIGNIGLLDFVPNYQGIQEIVTSATIPLALPMLLLSINIRSWFAMAGKAITALVTGLVSVIVMVTIGYFIFGEQLQNSWKIAGMLIGVYSGGTPNLAAIQSALNVDAETYLMVNTVDIVLSSLFLFVLMSFGKVLLRKFLPNYKHIENTNAENQKVGGEEYQKILNKSGGRDVLLSFAISLLIVLVSAGLSFLLVGDISMLILILSITSLSIAASLVPKINKLKYSFEGGMYLILIFSVVVASMANLQEMGEIALDLLMYLSFVVFGSLILHILLAKLFKVDADTLMVASTALICSPPFVPVIAGAIKNKDVIVSGLTVGIIGYAIGNYLGVSIAYLLKSFM